MLKVKISANVLGFPLIRQTPDAKGIWGNCQFFINEDIEECDYWVVYENTPGCAETSKCQRDNTILITGEPATVRRYSQIFLNQFGTIITTHPNIAHPNVILNQPGLPWFVGARFDLEDRYFDIRHYKSYTDLQNIKSYPKSKLLSVILSNKKMMPGHHLRLAFVEALRNAFSPDELDIFGIGFNEVSDKWDAIAPYQYNIVLENSVYPHYWTEKLADAYLGGAYPLYFGCPNIADYFPQESLTCIDIRHPQKAIDIIRNTISAHQYEHSKDVILKAKDMVLNNYNLFAVIHKFCNEKNRLSASKQSTLPLTIYPEQYYRESTAIGQLKKIYHFGKRTIRKIIYSEKVIAARVACVGRDVVMLKEKKSQNIKLVNIQKARVDLLLEWFSKKDRPKFEYIEPHMRRSDIVSLIKEQAVVDWFTIAKKTDYFVMDSYSELTDQKFTHKKEGWSFCCHYSDLHHTDDFNNEFKCEGLLPCDQFASMYRNFFNIFERHFSGKNLIFIHYSSKFDDRPKFSERAALIRTVIKEIASEKPWLINIDLADSDYYPNEKDFFPYHYAKKTYRKIISLLEDILVQKGYV